MLVGSTSGFARLVSVGNRVYKSAHWRYMWRHSSKIVNVQSMSFMGRYECGPGSFLNITCNFYRSI